LTAQQISKKNIEEFENYWTKLKRDKKAIAGFKTCEG
jgi:hypothetical protein